MIKFLQSNIDTISTVIAIVIIVVVLSIRKIKMYLNKFGQMQSVKRTQKFFNPCKNLKDHVIFQEIEDCLNFKIDLITFPCPLRKAIFTNLLKFRYKQLKEIFTEISNMPVDVINELPPRELLQKLVSISKHGTFKWVEEAKKSGIMESFLEKYINECHATTVYYYNALEQCIMDERFPVNYTRIINFFDCIWSVYCLFILDMKFVFNTLNGDLEHQTYVGVTCPGFDKCNKCHHNHRKKQEENNQS